MAFGDEAAVPGQKRRLGDQRPVQQGVKRVVPDQIPGGRRQPVGQAIGQAAQLRAIYGADMAQAIIGNADKGKAIMAVVLSKKEALANAWEDWLRQPPATR